MMTKEKSISTVLKEMPLWLWAIIVILSPLLLAIALIYLVVTLFVIFLFLPVVMIVSIKQGRGSNYFTRLKNNFTLFIKELSKIGDPIFDIFSAF